MQAGENRAASAALGRGEGISFSIPEVPDHSLLCLIGRGAYGEVWMARNAIGTLRAVKAVHRESFHRPDDFEREFKGLLRFEPISRLHEGLVDILQIGRKEEAGYFYYVMELADAITDGQTEYSPRTLRAELQRRGSLPPTEVVSIGLKLTSALSHLHTNGLVHRDIKPSNIIFVAGEPKLADIGLVTAIDEARSLVGTAGYIPPEGPGTPKADLYGLGKVLYETAFGKDRQEFPQLPPDLESHPDYRALLELNEIILRACETDSEKRYRNAEEMAKDLTLLRDGKSVKLERRLERRVAVVKKLALAAMLLLLITAFPFVTGSKYQDTPKAEARRESGSRYQHTPKAQAQAEYDLGKWYYSKLTPEDHQKAFQHLTNAVALDPQFVLPYRELTALYVWGSAPIFQNQAERLQKLKAIADTLLAIDPDLVEGHTALSWVHFLQYDFRNAEAEIVRAVQLKPEYAFPHLLYAWYLSMMLRVDEAHEQVRRSREFDHSARIDAIAAAWPYYAARQFDKAIEETQRVIDLDKNFQVAYSFLARCYEAQSNYTAAIDTFQKADLMGDLDPIRVNAGYDALRRAYDERGQEGYFRKMIELIREDEKLPRAQRVFFSEDASQYYAALNIKETALNEIEKHWDNQIVRSHLKFEPMYETLRDEPRFQALLKKAGLER